MSHFTDNDYRPAPFWFLNHKLEEPELRRQIRLMKQCGAGGFFMHARAGLRTPYGSKEWFDMVRVIVDEAGKQELKAWLYDEDPFPSGAAGGKVFFEHPEYAARSLKFYEFLPGGDNRISGDAGTGRLLEAVMLRCDAGGTVIECTDVTEHVGIIRPDYFMSPWHNAYYIQLCDKITYDHYRAETFNPRLHIDLQLPGPEYRVCITTAETVLTDEKYGLLPDNLNPDCVKLFLESTHEKYREYCGDEFGKVIPGIFTDETSPGGDMPWTGRFEETFAKLHGYALAGSYHSLFRSSSAQARKVRRDYWATVHHLFEHNFFQTVESWCREHSLALCGHLISEEDPLAMVDTCDLQKYFAVPGFDHITSHIPNGDFFSLNLGGKLVSSAALRQGRKKVLSECFGCNPFNFDTDGMKKIANWLFSLGVNFLVPHGFFYSVDGYRKYDAGKSFFFQSQDFDRFPDFAQYARRVGGKLGEARSLNHVGVLLPLSAMRSLCPAERTAAEAIREKLFNIVQKLLRSQVQFDIVDETSLKQGVIGGGKLVCGCQQYNTVIHLTETNGFLDPAILARVNELKACGILNRESLPQCAGLTVLEAENLREQYTLVKETPDGILIYIFNNFPEPATLKLRRNEQYPYAYVYDAEHDTYADMTSMSCVCGGFDAAVIEFRREPVAAPPYCPPTNLVPREYPFETEPQWDFSPPGIDCVAEFHRWDISLGDRNFKDHPFTLLRDLTGTELRHMVKQPRPIFDQTAPRPSEYPLRAEFAADFTLDSFNSLSLVLEGDTLSGPCRMFINDREIELKKLKREFVYDVFNLTCEVASYCRPGINTLRIVWENGGEFDGLRSALYLIAR